MDELLNGSKFLKTMDKVTCLRNVISCRRRRRVWGDLQLPPDIDAMSTIRMLDHRARRPFRASDTPSQLNQGSLDGTSAVETVACRDCAVSPRLHHPLSLYAYLPPQLMDGGGRMGPPLHSVARSRGSISLSDAGNPLAANRLFDVCGVGHYFAADPRRSHPFARGGEGRCRLWWWPVPCHIMLFAHCQMSSTLVGT